jgi:D-methionine transport system permease protein
MEGGELMFSDMLFKLLEKNLLQLGIWETIYMTVLSSLIAYIIGLPLGVILSITDQNGICPNSLINRVLGFVVNFFRSIPFIILMVAMLPVAKFILGTSLGNGAVIVMLVIAAAPYVGRMVESSVKEVSAGVIEAAQSMGCTNFQIITRVLLPEAKPALIHGAVISMVTILGYSAMAATIGGTGLGQIAIIYGHQRSNDDITWICVLLTVLIVQIIQIVGTYIERKTDKRIK